MSAIVWSRSSPAVPADFEASLVDRLRGRVDAAYVFGSYGTPAFKPGSDVDLILVMETELPFVERPRLFADLYQLYPVLDLLVYRADELERLLGEPVGFWASVRDSMRPLSLIA